VGGVKAGLAPAGDPLTLQRILGLALAPLAWLAGVSWADAPEVGSLLGVKTVLNELIAYSEMKDRFAADPAFVAPRSALLATYALCGFANFASIGIQVGGIGLMAPERRAELSRLGLLAMVGGGLASLMTAPSSARSSDAPSSRGASGAAPPYHAAMAQALLVTLEQDLPAGDALAGVQQVGHGQGAGPRDRPRRLRRPQVQGHPAVLARLGNQAALIAQLKEDGFDPSKMRVPPERWHPASEGLAVVRALIEHVDANLNDFKQPNPILRDLKAAEALLAAAEAAGVRFHFTKGER
jgi:hypothetical protein